MRKKLLFVVTLIAAMMFAVTGCGGKRKLSMADYVTLQCVGADGHGTATADFDFTQFEKDCVGDDDDNISQAEMEALLSVAKLEASIRCELDKSTDLANGDKVTVNVSYDKDLADEANVKITDTEVKLTVDGLVEGTKPIDPFGEESLNIITTSDSYFDEVDEDKATLSWSYLPKEDLYYVEVGTRYASSSDSAVVKYVSYTLKDGVEKYAFDDEITILAEVSQKGIAEGYYLTESEYTFSISDFEETKGVSVEEGLTEDDIATLKSEAQAYMQKSIDEDSLYVSYEKEDGSHAGPMAEKVTNMEINDIYRAPYGDVYQYYVIGKMHFTEEYIELVGPAECDQDIYFALWAMDIVSPVSDVYFTQHENGFTAADDLLNDIKTERSVSEMMKVD